MRLVRIICAGAMVAGMLVPSPAVADGEAGWLRQHVSPRVTFVDESTVVASMRVGSGVDAVGVEDLPDLSPWGPSSFAVAEDGGLRIVDGVNSRIVSIGADGSPQDSIPLRAPIVCPVDIEIAGSKLYLLDLPAQPAAVHEVDANGDVLRSWEIPEVHTAQGVTGFRVESSPTSIDIRLEISGSWEVALVERNRVVLPGRLPTRVVGNRLDIPGDAMAEHALGSPAGGRRFAVQKNWDTWTDAALTSYEGARESWTASIRSDAPIGTMRFVGEDRAGRVYVYCEQFADESDSWTAGYVKVFGPHGQPQLVAEVPVAEFYTFPTRFIRVTESGDVYVLFPTRDHVTVCRLRLRPDFSDRLPKAPTLMSESSSVTPGSGEGPGAKFLDTVGASLSRLFAVEAAQAAWTPLDANDRAWSYIGNKWYCTSANYSRSCGDSGPRYITSAGKSYSSVPYCWGGWDTVSGFNSDMANGLDAGDVNCTGGKKSCTSGVDCSGFVTRLWGLGSKRSTYTLLKVSRSTGKKSMRLGDAYIRPGYHAMFFRYYTTGGAQVFEATKSHRYDRVVSHTRTTSELGSYGAYRYWNW